MAHLVITIGCEYGAKGNQIGKKVAEDLGIKFYDRETVDEIIKEVGIPKDIMEKLRKVLPLPEKVQKGMSVDLFQICGFDRACNSRPENNHSKII